MFLRFMVFMRIFIISAACSFIMTELHEQHPENKRYKVYCILSFIIVDVAIIAGLYILRH